LSAECSASAPCQTGPDDVGDLAVLEVAEAVQDQRLALGLGQVGDGLVDPVEDLLADDAGQRVRVGARTSSISAGRSDSPASPPWSSRLCAGWRWR